VGSDAVRDLREWQRRAASAQEQALRSAAKAQKRLADLAGQQETAHQALVESLEALAATGVSRDQAAAFLGVAVSVLPNRTGGTKRAAAAGSHDAPGNRTGGHVRRPAS
jgi:hypothetical protein